MKTTQVIKPNKASTIHTAIKPLDIIIFLLAITLAIFSILKVTQNNEKAPQVFIDTPKGTYIYSLNENRELYFEGPLGLTYISIKDGQAIFTDSPCHNKTCMLTPPASENGDWIACLPNRIFLRIEAKEDTETNSGFDAISE